MLSNANSDKLYQWCPVVTKKGEKTMTKAFEQIRGVMVSLLDLSLLFVALGVVWQILFGAENSWYFGHVTANMMEMVNSFGAQGVAGVVAIVIFCYIFSKSSK